MKICYKNNKKNWLNLIYFILIFNTFFIKSSTLVEKRLLQLPKSPKILNILNKNKMRIGLGLGLGSLIVFSAIQWKNQKEKEDKDKVEIDKVEIDEVEIDEVEIDKVEIDKVEIDKQEIDKQEIDKVEIDKQEIDKQEIDKQEIDKVEIDKQEIDKQEADRKLKEQQEADRKELEKREKEEKIKIDLIKKSLTDKIHVAEEIKDINSINLEENFKEYKDSTFKDYIEIIKKELERKIEDRKEFLKKGIEIEKKKKEEEEKLLKEKNKLEQEELEKKEELEQEEKKNKDEEKELEKFKIESIEEIDKIDDLDKILRIAMNIKNKFKIFENINSELVKDIKKELEIDMKKKLIDINEKNMIDQIKIAKNKDDLRKIEFSFFHKHLKYFETPLSIFRELEYEDLKKEESIKLKRYIEDSREKIQEIKNKMEQEIIIKRKKTAPVKSYDLVVGNCQPLNDLSKNYKYTLENKENKLFFLKNEKKTTSKKVKDLSIKGINFFIINCPHSIDAYFYGAIKITDTVFKGERPGILSELMYAHINNIVLNIFEPSIEKTLNQAGFKNSTEDIGTKKLFDHFIFSKMNRINIENIPFFIKMDVIKKYWLLYSRDENYPLIDGIYHIPKLNDEMTLCRYAAIYLNLHNQPVYVDFTLNPRVLSGDRNLSFDSIVIVAYGGVDQNGNMDKALELLFKAAGKEEEYEKEIINNFDEHPFAFFKMTLEKGKENIEYLGKKNIVPNKDYPDEVVIEVPIAVAVELKKKYDDANSPKK